MLPTEIRGRSPALLKKRLLLFQKGKMIFLNKISTMFFRNKSAYQVGQRLYSSKKRKSLVLEREIFVNDIKHFRVRIEGMIIKKAVILSESALFQDHYEHIEDISDKKMLL